MAARAGNDDVVARLIEAGADPDAIVPDDETPLINPARAGHLQTVQYQVEHGADVNLGVTANLSAWSSPPNQDSDEAVQAALPPPDPKPPPRTSDPVGEPNHRQ